ncbi:MAG: hypothetical protein CL566_08350 [Alphaproteobacteria bacterium]|nr:hypothetical protein [Alphaproteobacteria bacterium]|tara:strand:+ start:1036 stop:1326 length:291 start_codon:yes stop_codon:yes gene_type:complete
MHVADIPFLREIVVFLVVTAILVPLFQRIRISPVYARSRDLEHAAALDAAGATRTIPELAESSLQMGAFVLTGLEVPSDAVNTLVDRLRDRGYEGI